MSGYGNCGTEIDYNTIQLTGCFVQSINRTVVRDAANVDPIGIKTEIDLTAELHTSTQNYLGMRVNWSLPPSSGLAPGIKNALDWLLQPRSRFRMTLGEETLFYIRPAAVEDCNETADADDVPSAEPDIANGPWTSVTVLSVAGKHAAKVRFHIEFTTPPRCPPVGSGEWGDVINCRWSVSDDVDCRTWTTTRRYQGVLRVRSLKVNAHALARQLVLPPKLRGFQRKRIELRESPDRLSLQFSITDEERWAQAPHPATDWEGTYSVNFPNGQIATEQDLSFRLWGAKEGLTDEGTKTDKQYLFALAANIVDKKLHWSEMKIDDPAQKPGDKGTIFVLSSNWEERLEANEISVRVRVKNMGPIKDLWNLPATAGKCELGKPLPASVQMLPFGKPEWHNDYDKENTYFPADGVWGSIKDLFLCALQHPCCTQSLSDATSPGTEYSSTQTEYTEALEYPPEDVIQQYEEHYSDWHNKSAYAYYKMSSRLVGTTGWAAFPLGKQCNATSKADTVAFAQMHCGVAVREIRLHAARINDWPQLPKLKHWEDRNEIKHVLAHYQVEPCPVQLSADGRDTLHEVSATYYYLLSRPPDPDDNDDCLLAGVLPYLSRSEIPMIRSAIYRDPGGNEQFMDPRILFDTGDA